MSLVFPKNVSVMGLAFVSLALLWCLSGCTPSESTLAKTIEKNPDIVFAIIEKHPEKFFAAVNRADTIARENATFFEHRDQIKTDLERPKEISLAATRIVGNRDALVTVVEYADYNCEHCAATYQTLEALRKKYGDKVRFMFKHLPILSNTSRLAAEYTEALRLQDPVKASEFRRELYENHRVLGERGEAFIHEALRKIGADTQRVMVDRTSDAVQSILESDIAEARRLDFSGTPGFLVNGAPIRGAYPRRFFELVIDMILQDLEKR